jgi:hypothetical protein
MVMYKTPANNIHQILNQTITSTVERIEHLHSLAVKYIIKILPDIHTDITTTKQEIWTDLSRLYYKYDDPYHKTAFREVIKEISQTINEDGWPTAYKRIYRNNRTTTLQRTP